MSYRFFLVTILFSYKIFAQDPKSIYEATILESDLKTHLTIIASDSMQGRETGTQGQKKAADYIIEHFKKIGLNPIVNSNKSKTYLQTFDLYKTGWKETYLKINNKKKVFFKDFYPIGLINIPKEQKIETVFVGYGIKTEGFDSFKNLNLKNKAIIFIEGEPQNADGQYIYSKSNISEWIGLSGNKKKQAIAQEMGAKYSFEISIADSEEFKTKSAERKAILSRFNRLALEQTNKESPSSFPSFIISQNLGAEILGVNSKILDDFIKNQSKIKAKKSTSISVKTSRAAETVSSSNILGFLEGTEKKEEVIVVSAHYDHIGTNEKGIVNNGADDDGSGTVAVMELAEAFSKARTEGFAPKRSILFLLFTAEEKGLLGSKFYTDIEPIIPLENTVCDLNIDMIGRKDKIHSANENYVYLIGSDRLSAELHQISEEANKNSVNLDLDYTFNNPNDPNRFYERSDHYNFAKNNIPVIFYFSGVHDDYHKPGDDVEKILFHKYNKTVKLVFNTLWELANRPDRIKLNGVKP